MYSVPWAKELPAAITVCDTEGIVLEMNDQAAQLFAKDGGYALIGTNLLDCHPEPARTQLREQLATGRTNVYTAQKHGIKRLVYQSPWHVDGIYKGLIELSFVLPDPLPHVDRDS